MDPILYDLLLIDDWNDDEGDGKKSEETSQRQTILEKLSFLSKDAFDFASSVFGGRLATRIRESLVARIENNIPWSLALAKNGHNLALIREAEIEIRSARDRFNSVAIVQVSPDSHLKWSQSSWSPDGSLLVILSSLGGMCIVSDTGQLLVSISSETTRFDFRKAPAGIAFLPSQKGTQGLYELVTISYGGLLRNYLIRSRSECILQHTFSFSDYLPGFVGSFAYSPSHRLLFVGSCSSKADNSASVVSSVSSWRILDGAPYYVKGLTSEEGFKKKAFFSSFFSKSTNLDLVFRMGLSPDGNRLATLDCLGQLTVWHLPSLTKYHEWNYESQLDLLHENQQSKKFEDYFVSIQWWSNEALILTQKSGLVTVVSVDNETLTSLFEAPEHFESGCHITSTTNRGFFILDCEGKVKRRLTQLFVVSDDEKNEDDDFDRDESFLKRTIKQLLYFLTDNNRFRPASQLSSQQSVKRLYHLSFLQSMTPKELFDRKLEQEHYGDAIALAQRFNLDTDLVYKTQWKACENISKASISDYLAKVSDDAWVIRECLSRIPDNFNAAKELVLYGLEKTESIVGNDDDKLSLTAEQIHFCRCRRKFLIYSDRLLTFQEILGGPRFVDERFSAEKYRQFRTKDALELAITYAQDGNWEAVNALLIYHGSYVLDHWLLVLSHFPETLSPNDYELILPDIDPDDKNSLFVPEQKPWRQLDWVESEKLSVVLGPREDQNDAYIDSMYNSQPALSQYRAPLTIDLVSQWFIYRAGEIEALSGRVDVSLELLRLGEASGFIGLEEMIEDLVTLEIIVYECQTAQYLGLDGLRQMDTSRRIDIIMEQSLDSSASFMVAFQKWLLPFLKRLDLREPGSSFQFLKSFLVDKSKENLELCHALCKSTIQGQILSKAQLTEIALACVYACERDDQLSVAEKISASLTVGQTSARNSMANHLFAVKILASHDVRVPIHFIRDIQNDEVEGKKLMIKMCRSANRKNRPLSFDEWENVQKDLETLKKRVFKCVETNTCNEVFIESLLCSGHARSIGFAGRWITGHKSRRETHGLADETTNKLPYEMSEELAVRAAKEYFNSASKSDDNEMDLARACLSLIDERTPRIEAELNLIAALALLNDFGVFAFPLQVRRTKNKIDLIKEALEHPKAYKSHQKLEKLGTSLGLQHPHDVRILIVHAAMKTDDVKIASQMCQVLVQADYKLAWEACKWVGESEKLENISLKQELLAFSAAHCPAEEIDFILESLNVLEVQEICLRATDGDATVFSKSWQLFGRGAGAVQHFVGDLVTRSQGVHRLMEKSAGAVGGLMSRSAEAVETLAGTRVGQSAGDFMRHCVGLMKTTREKRRPVEETEREDEDVLVAHPFYDIEGAFYCDENFRRSSDVVSVDQDLLRLALISGQDDGEEDSIEDVLSQLTKTHIIKDVPMALAYLLTLSEVDFAVDCLDGFPPTLLYLHFVLYYYSLQLFVGDPVSRRCRRLYEHPPISLIKCVLQIRNSQEGFSDDLTRFARGLDLTLKQLADFTYAQKLKEMDSTIDTNLFVSDEEYRRETIFKLVKSESDENYDTAVSLATHYSVPKRQLYLVYLTWLLTQSNLSSTAVGSKLEKLGVVSFLLEKPEELSHSLEESVYPQLPGCDLGRLLYYFNVLQSCQERGATVKLKLHTPETHVKLLKKLKTSVQGLDYKKLMSGEDSEATLYVAITSANGHVLAKMASKFPQQEEKMMTESTVYRILCEKLFWGGQGKSQEASTPIVWVERYDACQDFLDRLDGSDLKDFVQEAVASLRSINQMPVDSRIDIAKRAVRFARQRISGKEKEEDLRSTGEELNFVLKHVQSLKQPLLAEWKNAENDRLKSYALEYDQALGDHTKILALAQTLLVDGCPIDVIKNLITLAESVTGRKTTIRYVMATAVERLLEHLKEPEFDQETMRKLTRTIESVAEHVKLGGQLVKGEALLSILRPFCGNLELPIEPRTAVLQTLEKNLELGESEASLLTFYKSEAEISSAWTRKISPANVDGTEAQFQLLHDLIQQSSQLHQFVSLWKLIFVWSTETQEMASIVLPLVAKLEDEGSSSRVVQMRKEIHNIRLEVDKEVFSILNESDRLSAVKYALVTPHPDLHCLAMETLKKTQELPSDDELSELLIVRQQVISLLELPYYSVFVNYLTSSSSSSLLKRNDLQDIDVKFLAPGKERIEFVARLLYEAGFWAQAGSLLLKIKGTNSLVSTISLALGAAKKFFGK